MAKQQRGKRIGARGARPGRGSAAAGAASAPKAIAAAVPASRGRGAGYAIVCSECYAEFSFVPPAASQSAIAITCPDCLHVGRVAADDVMARIAQAKGSEKSYLLRAVLPGLLLLTCGLAWIVALTYYGIAGSEGANYGFLVVGIILLVAVFLGLLKYESNRFDVYF